MGETESFSSVQPAPERQPRKDNRYATFQMLSFIVHIYSRSLTRCSDSPRDPCGRSLLSCTGQLLALFPTLRHNSWHDSRHFNAIKTGIFSRRSASALMPHSYFSSLSHSQSYLLRPLEFYHFNHRPFQIRGLAVRRPLL